MQKMKHIWQNKAVVREKRQCQRKGQQGDNWDPFLFVPPALFFFHNPAACPKAGILRLYENKAWPKQERAEDSMGALWWLDELSLANCVCAGGQKMRQLWDNQDLPDEHLLHLGRRSGSTEPSNNERDQGSPI